MRTKSRISMEVAKAVFGNRYTAQGAIAAGLYNNGARETHKQRRAPVALVYTLSPHVHDRFKKAAATLGTSLTALSQLAVQAALPTFEKTAAKVAAAHKEAGATPKNCPACGR